MFPNLVKHRVAVAKSCGWVAVLVALLVCPVLSAQEAADSKEKSDLDLALEHSRLTGKPLFAVAGRST